MAQAVSVKNTGLRGVAVADTKISFIDAEKGVLIYGAIGSKNWPSNRASWRSLTCS